MLSHPISAIPLFGSIILERAAYYGLRACFVLFLISDSVNMTEKDAFSFYGFGGSVLAVSYLFGGLLGLLKQPRILTLCGLGIQFIGTLLLAFSLNKMGALLGFAILSFGTGMAKPNLYALFGQLYNRSKRLDSGMIISYMAVNIGAFLGVWLMGEMADENGFVYAFYLCALLLAASFGLVLMAKPASTPQVLESEKSNYHLGFIPVIILVSLIGSLLFWISFESVGAELIAFQYESSAYSNFDSNFFLQLNFPVILILSIVLALLYSYKRVSTSLQFTLAFLVAAFSYYILFGLEDKLAEQSDSVITLLVLFYVLQSIAEVLFTPVAFSFILRKIELQFAPLVIGGFLSLSALGMRFYSGDCGWSFYTILEWGVWTMLTLALVFAILFFLIKNEKTNQKTEQSTIYQDDDVLV